jgi:eukaryotic-like serine/threonine-protein kinase
MKFIDGQSLDKRLKDYAEDSRGAAQLLIATAGAIHHAHRRGILHRDLKPANVLVDADGQPHVTDFGLAREVDSQSEITHSGMILGTPAYMAPEQASGNRSLVTISTDIHGLGAILYALLTGRAPFSGTTVLDTLEQVRERLPEPPRKLNPRVPRDLEVICLKSLEKDWRQRYESADALAADLHRWLRGEPIEARPVTWPERAVKWARRKPTLAAAYTLGFFAALFGGLGGTAAWQWRNAERARNEAVKARAAEQIARSAAENEREKFERFEYGRAIEVAHQEWRDNNVPATLALLEATRADLRGWEWRYLNRLCHLELVTLTAKTSVPSMLGNARLFRLASFNADGSRVLTATADGLIKIWDATSGAEILHYKTNDNKFAPAFFNCDGTRMVTAGSDGQGKVCDTNSGAVVATFKGAGKFIDFGEFSPDGSRIVTVVRSSGFDARKVKDATKVWDAKTGAELVALDGLKGFVTSASFSPDGTRIVTASSDRTAKIWDVKTGVVVRAFGPHSDIVTSAAFSPDGARVVTSSNDGTAKIWEVTSGANVVVLAGRCGPGSFSPDGGRIVAPGAGMTARVWDARTGAELLILRGDTEAVASASFSSDGHRVLTASSGKTVKVWDADRSAEVLTLTGHTGHVVSASFTPDGSRVATASHDNTVRIWDGETGQQIRLIETGSVESVSFGPDGSRLLTAAGSRVGIWDARTGVLLRTLKGLAGGALMPSFSVDGSRIVAESNDGTKKTWDATSGAEILAANRQRGSGGSTRFSPDGSRVVGIQNWTAIVWNATSGADLITLTGHSAFVISASFSPDGKRIVTGSFDKTAKVWDAETGAELFTLKGHTGFVRPSSFSPDGSRIVTGSDDGTAKVWDAISGAEVLTLKGHGGLVDSAAFSPDGSRIVTGSWDNTAKIWDARPLKR